MRRSALLPILMASTAALAEGQPSLIWLDMPRGKVSIEINGVEGNENGHGLVVNAPGSRGGVTDAVAIIGPLVAHIIDQLAGGDHPRA